MSLDKEIVDEFLDESRGLIEELLDLLAVLEDDYSEAEQLSDYGNKVDRIMGASKSLALMAPADHPMHMISDYAALCKAVGYQASQIKNNEHFFQICVALLLDATEVLKELLKNINEDGKKLRSSIPPAFIDRLRWVTNQFGKTVNVSVTIGETATTMTQADIDDLLKKLGL